MEYPYVTLIHNSTWTLDINNFLKHLKRRLLSDWKPRGVWLTPYRTLLAPLEVFYGKRFGSKHHTLVQLAKIHWVGITDPFLVLRGPSWGSQKVVSWANQVLSVPLKVSKFHFVVQKCIISVVTTQMEHYLIFRTISVHLGPSNDLIRGQKPGSRRLQKGNICS